MMAHGRLLIAQTGVRDWAEFDEIADMLLYVVADAYRVVFGQLKKTVIHRNK